MLPSPAFWRGKRVLLTGHTGFKGAWLGLWLARLGAEVYGMSLPPATQPSLALLVGTAHLAADGRCDIRDVEAVREQIMAVRPDVVFHLAAQALVRASYTDPLNTFSTNLMGTAHVLDAVRCTAATRVLVAVTTDKVYQNLERLHPYCESDALGGHDPYSASKAASELLISSYFASFLRANNVAMASARAGNVIGGGDWSSDRLLPDAVRAWTHAQPLHIRNPEAVRPWQHVLEPLSAYLVLAQRLWQDANLSGAYNFGPRPSDACSVRVVVEQARKAFSDAQVQYGEAAPGPHEAGLLTLDSGKAERLLGVVPRWSLDQAVQRSMAWYRHQYQGADVHQLCLTDIDAYENASCPA